MSQVPHREIFLAKAGELFHKQSYASVSIESIIEAAQMPRAEFYKHFSSKSDLGQLWLQRLHKRMSLTHENFFNRLGDRERRLKRYFLSMLSWLKTNGFRSCQFANTIACIDREQEPEMAETIDRYKREQREFFIKLCATLVDESEAQKIGTTVFLLYSGAMTEAQNLKATWPLEDALAAAEQLCGIEGF